AYTNIRNVYYYMAIEDQANTLDDAKKFFNLAHSLLQQNPDISGHSLVSFGLARVEYQIDNNYDCYLNSLRISEEYARKEGRLDSLVEILFEECKIRMQIGEYYLAKKALDFSQNTLKNVGRIPLKHQWETLNDEYLLRTGQQVEKLLEEAINELINKVEVRERKAIILFEAKREKVRLAPLFSQLGVRYMENQDWQRLLDVAQCFLDAASNDSQRIDALYMLGCATAEMAKFLEAKDYFCQIVDIGKGINDLKLGWAHFELARLLVKRGDITQATHHIDKCINVLKEFGDMEQLTHVACNILAELFRAGYIEQAESAATQLLSLLDDSNAVKVQKYLKHLRQTNDQHACNVILNQPPQAIATEALSLYDSGDTVQAWELMRLAKKKYRKAGNLDGEGKCENNMGIWCLKEKNYEEAVLHLKTAMDIKFSLGDVGGGINQLSALLQIYTELLNDFEKAGEFAREAEKKLPLCADKVERYLLYYSLALYNFHIEEYALALKYSKMAKEGMPYILNVYPKCEEILRLLNNELEKIFMCQFTSADCSEFEKQVLEAARLGKIGETNKCLDMLEKLKSDSVENNLEKGILEGTCANAFLEVKEYDKAIKHFNLAMENFEKVTGDQREKAISNILTAVNGISIALGRLGREEEAIKLLRKELKRIEMPSTNKYLLTLSLCNRLITLHQDTLQKDDKVFTEICNKLNSLVCLNHEEQGGLYSAYGALYNAIGDKNSARQYYQKAKKEFLPINSRYLAKVDKALEMLS
ncbi:MAG: hypothetical protein K2I23_07250, partial [Clostridia bacterium]|nr:hypothetical protein [Clostridia bacterium]